MNVISINFNHDGAMALFKNGDLAGYVNTERRSRIKKHPGIRECDISDTLDQASLQISDIDLVILVNLNTMDSPEVQKLHGTNLKETWPDFWIDASYKRVRLHDRVCACRISTQHHLHHAALAYFFSTFDSGVSFACDPIGAVAYFFAEHRRIRAVKKHLIAPLIYDRVSSIIFGTALIGAGKLMGLAPYGSTGAQPVDYAALTKMPFRAALNTLLEAAQRDPVMIWESGKPLNASLAHYAQEFLEYALSDVLNDLSHTCASLGLAQNLCLAGGTALNSTANQRCFAGSPFEQLYLHPACGDDGTAIGAALSHWHLGLGEGKRPRSNRQAMYGCRTYERQIGEAIAKHADRVTVRATSRDIEESAELIAQGKVIGWFQGASEIGPRALGNRSILADPRAEGMKDYLNRTIKKREAFRPFAPSIINEHAREWFGIVDSPFMLRIAPLRRTTVPAVTHVDGTARFQTVSREDNPRFHKLLVHFTRLTQVPMVLNTSFNGDGEPIVETPDEAIRCMLRTGLDALVFPGFIVTPAQTITIAEARSVSRRGATSIDRE